MPIRSLAVFLASSDGVDPAYGALAHDVGAELARRGIQVVYGAGGQGLMGRLADGALSEGGRVVGVIPHEMVRREWGRSDLTELHVVDSMHERKAMMAQRADAFLALPGGLGTLEEIFEVWTWRAVGFHDKPVGFLDAHGFWTPLLDALRGIGTAGFLADPSLDDLVVATTLDDALSALEQRLAPVDPGLRPGT
ncbi:MAG: TIGR00730 family Rossman fold protein [Nocardioidaceae bacterium]